MSRSTVRVALRVAVATFLTVSGALVALPMQAANAVSPNIVISQVYGAGGNTGATYQRDYIELFNRGATSQSVTGWSVQYTSSSGTGLFSSNITNLSGSIQAGGYYLVAESTGTSCSGSPCGVPLPAPVDVSTGTIAMAGGAGKVIVANTTTGIACNGSSTPCSAGQLAQIVDLVGYGAGTNFFEGSGPTGTTTVANSAFRNSNGCTDTDNNAGDFTVAAANPRNSGTTAAPCVGDAAPSVGSTNPTNGATGVSPSTNVTVNFSESVHVTSAWLTLSGSSSGAHTFTYDSSPTGQTEASTWVADPGTDFTSGETVTATVVATEVGDTDSGANDPPENMASNYQWTFDIQPADTAPTVSSTNPSNGQGQVALNTNIDITFSEPVSVTASAFSISGSSSGSHTYTTGASPATLFTLDPDSDFLNGETVTVTVFANQVTDQDATDPPDNMAANYVFSFSTPLRIHDIQAATHISPYAGQAVNGIPGIVTAKRTNGFYMQDPVDDANDATSEGIFVFTSSAPMQNIGDSVSVSGTVSEFRAGGAASVSLTVTELTSPTIVVNSSGNPLPTATVVGSGGRIPPNTQIEDDATGSVETSGVFDPAADGIDFWESLEFMRVQLNDAHVVGPTSDFGTNREVPVVGDNGANATILTPRGGILLRETDNNPERIILNDVIVGGPTLASTVDVGDSYPGATVGVIDYNFNNFKLEVTQVPTLLAGSLPAEVTPVPGSGQLSVASFNLENLDPNDPASKFQDLANQVVTNLRSPDLIGLEEVQDNNGATNDSVVDASTTLNLFIGYIQAAGGPAYDFRQINPVDDQDGGEPGGNIRVAFLFRVDRGLSFVDRPGGGSTTANTVVSTPGGPQLQYSPGRIAPSDQAWTASRKPLAAEFTYGGNHLFAIVNHFNSKGGDQPLWGRFQPPTLSSEAQRIQQAQLVHDFTSSILSVDANADVIVLGDLNDFTWSNPLQTLTAGGVLEDLVLTLPEAERYSYVFEGNTQELDHLLASPHLSDELALYDAVHINAEFAPQVSDHDPLVANFSLVAPVTCTINGGNGPQTINGTPLADHICGRGGNDVINGMGGNDVIDGGTGNDTIDGGEGDDKLLGKKGADDITGGPGDDFLKGGFGNDTLHGVDGVNSNDSMDGGKGFDVCSGDSGDVTSHCP